MLRRIRAFHASRCSPYFLRLFLKLSLVILVFLLFWKVIVKKNPLDYTISGTAKNGMVKFHLTGSDWILTGGSKEKFYNVSGAKLPGDVYLELFSQKIIPDPYYRDNDVKLRWISKENWQYAKHFHVTAEFLKHKYHVLVLESVDTIATVELNGVLLTKSGPFQNQFRIYRLLIYSTLLKIGLNRIQILFNSSVKHAEAEFALHEKNRGYSVPPGASHPPSGWHGESHVQYLRKMQASFSWDWGPAFPTMGVNGVIDIVAFDSCLLTDASAIPFILNTTHWLAQVSARVSCHRKNKANFVVEVEDLGAKRTIAVYLEKSDENVLNINVTVNSPKIWWPSGYGEQKTYVVKVSLQFDGEEIDQKIDSLIGFRSIELIEQPPQGKAEFGLTFYFKVNGIPIFLKGSNWIPADAFQSRLGCSRIRHHFRSMKEAHMNALRVWGGGVYEVDCFYALADEYGVLIWQDFMFACSLYPATETFLENVRLEFRDQLWRLKSHPSILVWCGNNENEFGYAYGWWGHSDNLKKDYLALYNGVMKQEISAQDPSRPFVLSSSSNGKRTEEEGGMSADPNNDKYGDKHYWTPISDGWTPAEFPSPRCASEYGVQSMASLDAFKEALDPADLGFDTPLMNHRQHQFQSHAYMTGYIANKLPSRPNCAKAGSGSKPKARACDTLGGDLGVMVYLTQLMQAMIIKTETEHYRRGRSILQPSGEGLTMCALYWQLNDIWQAPTWSSIDFTGRWKMLHYAAKRFMAPLIVSPYLERDKIQVYAVSDLVTTTRNISLVAEVFALGAQPIKPLQRVTWPIQEIPALSSVKLAEVTLKELLSTTTTASLKPSSSIINFSLLDFDLETDLSPNNIVYPDGTLKNVDATGFGRVRVAGVLAADQNQFLVTLKTDSVALFVWLNTGKIKGHFSDNGFTMVNNELNVTFHSYEQQTLKDFERALTATSLGDVYLA